MMLHQENCFICMTKNEFFDPSIDLEIKTETLAIEDIQTLLAEASSKEPLKPRK